jgi:DNA-binding transcriptional ArsR family regulator
MTNDAFKALAHPLRRDIVERLSGGVATVGEVTRDFGVSKPTISRHLKMLEEAGVVSRVIDGRTHRLALRPEALAEASDWIESQRERWERLVEGRRRVPPRNDRGEGPGRPPDPGGREGKLAGDESDPR